VAAYFVGAGEESTSPALFCATLDQPYLELELTYAKLSKRDIA